ncbi:MAG: enoyl-CoA hydratase [Solirubrobacteraceae bacterium]|nr:enoyl-CoA hydratase [Solirubrobacteraceae bacterium]
MPPFVTVESVGDVALVRIDRPPANALDVELLAEGQATADELRGALPSAVVLTGRPGFFSAGADLKVVPTLDPAGQQEMVRGINGLFTNWYSFPRPVVCAVNGHAIAGGLILALCGDYRVGPTSGRVGLTELRVGIPYPAAAMAIVRAELTPPAARLLTLRANLLEADAAHGLGLFDEIAEGDRVVERALEVAAELAALPPATYEHVKMDLRRDPLAEARRAIAEESDPLLARWFGDEARAAAEDAG